MKAVPSQRMRMSGSFVDRLPSHLLVALIFTIPVTTAGSNVLAAFLLVAWLVRRRFRADWQELRGNPVALAALGFFGLHVVGLLWSADLAQGLAATQKEWKFLLLPVFLFSARTGHAGRYVGALLLSMAVCVAASFCIRFGVLEPWGRATIDNPVPFGTHVVYGPLLAFAIYLAAERLLFGRLPPVAKAALAVLLVAMATNLFMTAGRAGHVMFFGALALIGWQLVSSLRTRRGGRKRTRTVAFVTAAGAAAGIAAAAVLVAFLTSSAFRTGVTDAVADVHSFDVDPASPVGERIAYAAAGVDVFLEHPLAGVGTGDLPRQIDRALTSRGLDVRRRNNPHSMYVMAMVQFGILGLAALGWLFVAQLRVAWRREHGSAPTLARIGVAMPLLYALICFAESYLAVHATALLFAAFSGFLYKQGDGGAVGDAARGQPAPAAPT
ncbi:MAG: O-antigen ligase family protein [Gammaproteobacteria bacterium]|nr:O-antigen ligase family protein [Gammaproteobacteria bacterium]MYB37143.1 O-antigen ligase family protein [Gammaproteobacteria bacterium]